MFKLSAYRIQKAQGREWQMRRLFKGQYWLISLTVLLLAEPSLSSTEKETLNYQGLNRTYYLHVPENLKQGASLVVVLHG